MKENEYSSLSYRVNSTLMTSPVRLPKEIKYENMTAFSIKFNLFMKVHLIENETHLVNHLVYQTIFINRLSKMKIYL